MYSKGQRETCETSCETLYPKSANVYDSLGEAMEKAGKTNEAIENYRTAVEIGAKNNDRNLQVYKENLERVESTK